MKEVIHPELEPKLKKKRSQIAGPSAMAGGVHVRAQIVSPDLCGMSSPEGEDTCIASADTQSL
jgi:hypothetical protein